MNNTSVSRVLMRSDGGSRGNPGPAGYGAAIFSHDGTEILVKKSGFIGNTTNNVAEYHGVIAGLLAARQLGAQEVLVELDSKLIVEQLSGNWKIKNDKIRTLAIIARDLQQQFDTISFSWIPREKNSVADKLANEAMDNPATHPMDEFFLTKKITETPKTAKTKEITKTAKTEETAPTSTTADQTKDSADVQQHNATSAIGVDKDCFDNGWGVLPACDTRIILVRHGQIPFSIDRLFAGRTDQELTEQGHRQAQQLAKYLITVSSPVALISSPLTRALQTAQYISECTGLAPIVDSAFIETDFGQWEGLSGSEVAQRDEQIYRQWLHNAHITPPGGESIAETFARVAERIRELSEKYQGQTIIIVSHVGPIKAAVGQVLGIGPEMAFKMFLELASITVIDVKPSHKGSLRAVNETSFHHVVGYG